MKASRGLQFAASSVGLPRLTLYDLRRTFAARCVASGMSPAVLCRLCGWSFASTSLARIFGAHGFEVEDANDAMKDLKVTN